MIDENNSHGLVADVAFAGGSLDDFIGKEFFGIIRVIAAGPGTLDGFIHGGAKRLTHFEGHYSCQFVFFGFKEVCGLAHHVAAVCEKERTEFRKGLLRQVNFFFDLCVRQCARRS